MLHYQLFPWSFGITAEVESVIICFQKNYDKIKVPVLFSLNNKIDKSFDADAVSGDGKIVLEVEAGRAYVNN